MEMHKWVTLAVIGGHCIERDGEGPEHGWWDRATRAVRKVVSQTPGAAPPMPGQPFWMEYGEITVLSAGCPKCSRSRRVDIA